MKIVFGFWLVSVYAVSLAAFTVLGTMGMNGSKRKRNFGLRLVARHGQILDFPEEFHRE